MTTTTQEQIARQGIETLDASQGFAVLATSCDSQPYTSIVAFAMAPGMSGAVFATPKKTSKYKNILKDPRVSMLLDLRPGTGGGLMEAEAVTIIGKASTLRRGLRRTELEACLMKKHPELAAFFAAPDTAIVYVKAEKYVHVGRFQSVSIWSPMSES